MSAAFFHAIYWTDKYSDSIVFMFDGGISMGKTYYQTITKHVVVLPYDKQWEQKVL